MAERCVFDIFGLTSFISFKINFNNWVQEFAIMGDIYKHTFLIIFATLASNYHFELLKFN